jgi:anti-sigma B factor antagonist
MLVNTRDHDIGIGGVVVRPTSFEITESSDDPVRTLAIVGELDLSTVPLLAERLDGTLGVLRLDLSELTFMDSSGLRLLIELNQRSEREGWKLTLIPPRHEPAMMVLRLTGADEALPFENPSA